VQPSCASTAWYRGVIRRGVGSGQDGADAAHQTGSPLPVRARNRTARISHCSAAREGMLSCSAWRDDRPLPSPGDGIVTAQTRAQKSQSLARACTHHRPAMSAFGQTRNQFTSMPWALITLPHLSTSSAMCFANPSAVNGIGSTPNWDNRSFTMRLACIACAARFCSSAIRRIQLLAELAPSLKRL